MTDNTQLFKSGDFASTDIQLFYNVDFGDLHVAIVRGEVWFIAKNVCDALDISNVSQALSRLDDDEKGIISNDTLGGSQKMLTVNEAGLYALALSSKKPEAKNFKRWVTHEVIPSIRKHGVYATPETAEKLMDDPDFMIATFAALKDERERRMELEAENAELAPKALLAEAVVEPSDSLYTVTEATRYLANVMPGIRRQDVFDLLRDSGMMCKRSTAPTRRGVDTGRMAAVSTPYVDPDTGEERAGRQRGKITCKGLAFLTERLSARVA